MQAIQDYLLMQWEEGANARVVNMLASQPVPQAMMR